MKQLNNGFTLIEMLVVITILALLAAVATPQVMKHLSRAKTQTARMEIKNLSVALDLFHIDVGRYPKQEEGLSSLLKQPLNLSTWNGPYVDKNINLADPWGIPYVYRIPGQHGDYDLFSLGADGLEGGSDENADVTNWQ